MNISITRPKMNISRGVRYQDSEILKALLGGNVRSLYALNKITGISIATLLRRIRKLEELGLIKTMREESGRRAISITLSPKGYAYLLTECDISDDEAIKIVTNYFDNFGSPKIVKIIGYNSLKRWITKIRSHINVKYFDENAFNLLLLRSYFECFIEEAINNMEKIKSLSKREIRKIQNYLENINDFIRSNPDVKEELIRNIDVVYNFYKAEIRRSKFIMEVLKETKRILCK